MKTQRIEELMTAMKSFGKESYHKSELLNEMFALQQEIVELTFSGEHAATAELKIWDVERHLEQLNADCGNIADEELAEFLVNFKNTYGDEYEGEMSCLDWLKSEAEN